MLQGAWRAFWEASGRPCMLLGRLGGLARAGRRSGEPGGFLGSLGTWGGLGFVLGSLGRSGEPGGLGAYCSMWPARSAEQLLGRAQGAYCSRWPAGRLGRGGFGGAANQGAVVLTAPQIACGRSGEPWALGRALGCYREPGGRSGKLLAGLACSWDALGGLAGAGRRSGEPGGFLGSLRTWGGLGFVLGSLGRSGEPGGLGAYCSMWPARSAEQLLGRGQGAYCSRWPAGLLGRGRLGWRPTKGQWCLLLPRLLVGVLGGLGVFREAFGAW